MWMMLVACEQGDPKKANGDSSTTTSSTSTGTFEGFRDWTKDPCPVFEGQFPLIGDPSVRATQDGYEMYYTCYDAFRKEQGPEICHATSTDGLNWQNTDTGGNLDGRVLQVVEDSWHEAHETVFAIDIDGATHLYFVGYEENGGFFGSPPVQMGLAIDTGVGFNILDQPVLMAEDGGPDDHGLTSPSLVPHGDGWLMFFSGFCLANCTSDRPASLMAATSSDGRTWKKQGVVDLTLPEYALEGVAETELSIGPDGRYYLVFTTIPSVGHSIGIAVADDPFGPWTFAPTPIITSDDECGAWDEDGVVAPLLFEEDQAHLWFHGFGDNAIRIGHAEAEMPVVGTFQ